MSDLTIAAEHLELRKLRPWLENRAAHLDAPFIGAVELCVHELATNVIDHSGAPELSLHMLIQASFITVELRDRGAPLATTSLSDLEPHPRVRGYGMVIAEELADDVTYERIEPFNVWRARFDLA